MLSLSLGTHYLEGFIKEHELLQMEPQVKMAHQQLHNRTGAGNEFLGWLDLPLNFDAELLENIKNTASQIRQNCDVFIVIGVGGSYLGARAAIEFLSSPSPNALLKPGIPEIYFVGNSFSTDYLNNILDLCENKDVCINMISKSGTTAEPALAFRVFREYLIDRYGEEESAKHIFCTTDKSDSPLKNLAVKNGYKTFDVPDDVGGRYSVLTAVGLLPIAVAGCDIDLLLEGAAVACEKYSVPSLMDNDCYKYAAIRNILNRKGKTIEILVTYEPAFSMMGEWFKQLFGESEGKDGKGIFPTSMIYSTDLHSLGQLVQDGYRNLFETVIHIKNSKSNITVSDCSENNDGLNFLTGMTFDDITRRSMEGTILAHTEGGVPNILIEISNRDEYSLGQLIYFFEKACAISGYILGVNPFDQLGVESYKRNMFALLGKPGFENIRQELEQNL